GTAGVIRCQRVKKSFTTPFALADGPTGFVDATAVPQIAHSVSSENRYPPQREQNGALSPRSGWNPGSSAVSSGVYERPHTRHFVWGRGLHPFERGEALGDAAGLCLAEPRESDQPLEIALVHRRVGVHVLLKARCIVRITPSIQSVNMAFRRATSRRSRRDPP